LAWIAARLAVYQFLSQAAGQGTYCLQRERRGMPRKLLEELQ
jgi:hypothetical protein